MKLCVLPHTPMRKHWAGVILGFGLLTTTPFVSASSWQISVDVAPFPTVENAANGESTLAWEDRHSPAATACTLGYAAMELREHLRQITPHDFAFITPDDDIPARTILLTTLTTAESHPIIGPRLTALNIASRQYPSGAYLILPMTDSLAIIGTDRIGTLYGVYAFLESLGVRWYGPEAHEIHLPDSTTLQLPTEPLVSAPDFASRGFWARQDRGNVDFYRWMARNRMNFWSLAEPNRPLLHKLGMHLTFGGHQLWEKYLDPHTPYPFDHVALQGDEHLPADPYAPPATTYRGDVDADGQLTFFEARPEWYGTDEHGERTPFDGHFGMNVCTSNPDVLHYFYDQIVKELAEGEWRDVDSLNFWSLDHGVWCHCPPCTALGEPTDRLLLLVHGLEQAMDQALADGTLQRSIKIIFPIYQKTITPPTRPLPKDFNYATNVGTFFPIRRCYVHTINDPTCTEYNVVRWEAFHGWTQNADRHYRGEIFVGEYFNVSANKSLPVIYPRIIQEDVPNYYSTGARHMHYMHTDVRLLGVKRINNFLFARMLWETDTDLTPEIDAYFANLFGPVAEEMHEVYRELEFAHSNIRQFRYWDQLPTRISEQEFPLYHRPHFQLEKTVSEYDDGVDMVESIAAFQRLRAILDDVLSRDLPDPIRQRLAIDDQTIRYGENTVYFYDAVARAMMAEEAGDLELARHEFWRSLGFARALKAETELTNTAVHEHARALDGLHATRIEEALLALGERLAPTP
jgi:hypothetical protein